MPEKSRQILILLPGNKRTRLLYGFCTRCSGKKDWRMKFKGSVYGKGNGQRDRRIRDMPRDIDTPGAAG